MISSYAMDMHTQQLFHAFNKSYLSSTPLEVITQAVSNGANVDASSFMGSPLSLAIEGDNEAITNLLLQHDAKIEEIHLQVAARKAIFLSLVNCLKKGI